MKKFLCILMAALMALSAMAFAETAVPTLTILEPETKPLTTEDKLYEMIPVLDSLARSMYVGTGEEVEYDPMNEVFAWTQVYLMGVNWAQDNEAAVIEGDKLVLPGDLIWGYATASFGSNQFGLPYESEQDFISYDEETETCALQLSDPGASYIVIERYAIDDEENLTVGVGVYAADEMDRRMGGFVASMSPATLAKIGFTHDFPYQVNAVELESEDDFKKMKVVDTGIKYDPLKDMTAEEIAALGITVVEEPAYITLRKGSKGDEVLALQKRLNKLGYNCGKADGDFGSNTRSALRYFQSDAGMDYDGIASIAVQKVLFSKDAPEYERYIYLSSGDVSYRVEKMERRLRELNYLAAPVGGVYDSRVEEAIELFQEEAELKVNGRASVSTQKELFDDDAPVYTGFITLKRNDTGAQVEQLQTRLDELGLLPQEDVDFGRYDTETVEAMKAFLEQAGIKGNGKTATVEMQEALFGSEPVVTPEPTVEPTVEPTMEPVVDPTKEPEVDPTEEPTVEPTAEPTAEPTVEPTAEPTVEPTVEPTAEPTAEPTEEPKPVSTLTKEERKAMLKAFEELLGEEMDEKEAVKWIQLRLGFEEVDGIYGELTREAVFKLQEEMGMEEPTGVPDYFVINHLMQIVL